MRQSEGKSTVNRPWAATLKSDATLLRGCSGTDRVRSPVLLKTTLLDRAEIQGSDAIAWSQYSWICLGAATAVVHHTVDIRR